MAPLTTWRAFRRAVQTATPALALGTAALTAVLAACSDSPTGPASSAAPAPSASATPAFVPGPHRDISSTTTLVNVLTRTTPLSADLRVSGTVTTAGGTLSIPQAGLTVRFPAGVVGQATTFTVTAKQGRAVAYDFQPSGTFGTAVTITQQLAGTNWRAIPYLSQVKSGYLANWSQLVQNAQGDEDDQGATASANELVPAQASTSAGTITFGVRHFSGYLVAWNRGGN